MRPNILFTIFIFAISITMFSCKKTLLETEKVNNCEHNNAKPIFNTDNLNNLPITTCNTSVCGLLPLSNTAKWIYRDSIFNEQGAFSEIIMDTLFVQQTMKSTADNSTWWSLKCDRYKGIPSKIHTTDSTLYMMDFCLTQNNKSLKAYEWLQLIPQDSVGKSNNYSDIYYVEMNKKLKSKTVHVPLGSFSDCIQNIKYLGDTNDEIIFKPEYGVIKYTSYKVVGNPFVINPAHKLQVSELVRIIK
jgi:hypothetical protein